MVDNRKNSFEFLGYDFMVDEDLKVWLIEINSSPSMDSSTVSYFNYEIYKILIVSDSKIGEASFK